MWGSLTLGNILLQISQTSVKQLLLMFRDLADLMDLLNTVGPEFDL